MGTKHDKMNSDPEVQEQLRLANEIAGMLAERIVDLEADMRVPWHFPAPADDGPVSPEARRFQERIETLRLQLVVARAHEDELTTELVGLRATVGDITDRARTLDDVLESLRGQIAASEA